MYLCVSVLEADTQDTLWCVFLVWEVLDTQDTLCFQPNFRYTTGNLDTHASDQLIELIRKLNKQLNQTFVLVTHSQRVAGQLDRVLELVGGKVNPINQSLLI